MADRLKTLFQSVPGYTLTDAYTVPAGTQTTTSSIVVCNQMGQEQTFRISVAVAGAADDPKQYLYYDVPVRANDTFVATIGLTLAASDVIRVLATNVGVSFNGFGVEVS